MCTLCLLITEPTKEITKIILPNEKGCVLGTAHKIKPSPRIPLHMKQRLVSMNSGDGGDDDV